MLYRKVIKTYQNAYECKHEGGESHPVTIKKTYLNNCRWLHFHICTEQTQR